ncbi:MAG: tRNA (cytidine(34)-2'-O)-methyltransferase [Deltaproteobacteria bacterium]|nr:tRNA (cytidine(34)-2'-O)-methyltransferase [Deltaproteobacteria bacterium]
MSTSNSTLFLVPPEPRFNIVLVRPQIPPNTGNIARLCAVTGSRLHLVAPLGFRVTDKDLRRAGLDYWDKVWAATWSSFDELVKEEKLSADQVHLFTGRVGPGTKALWDATFVPGQWLVMGEEATGLPEEVLAQFPERWVRVPMIAEPSARSLNLATCTGVVLYEAIRQCRNDVAARAAR